MYKTRMLKKGILCVIVLVGLIGTVGAAGLEHINKVFCEECAKIDDSYRWYVIGDKHYKMCNKNHTQLLGEHVYDENGECVCGEMHEFYAERISKECRECGEKLTRNWKQLGGDLHYQECSNGHKNDMGRHEWTHDDLDFRREQNVWEDNECKICKKRIPAYPPAAYLAYNKILNCLECGEIIEAKWYQTVDGKHYRSCVNNHHSFIGAHDFVDGQCMACRLSETNTIPATESCNICGGAIDPKYYITENGTHYRTCSLDFSHKYEEAHKWEGNHCPVCDLYRIEEATTSEQENQVKTNTDMIFTDVPNNHWAAKEIRRIKELGIINGYEDGSFRPEGQITAREFFAFLSRVLDKKNISKSTGKVYLDDKLKDDWSHGEFVSLMQALGTTNANELGKDEVQMILGESDEIVLESYNKPINRESAASIMAPFVNKSGKVSSVDKNGFVDWDEVTLKSRINSLVDAGLLKGRQAEDGTLFIKPKDDIKRAEAIVLMSRLYDAI